jgi:hypothetical protein
VFLVDSGATHHCVRERSLFSSFRPGKHIVRVANDKTISSTGKGDVRLTVKSSSGSNLLVTLRDVFFVPSLANNIFSTNRLMAVPVLSRVPVRNRNLVFIKFCHMYY